MEYIVHNGMMKDLSVLQESPFTDQGSAKRGTMGFYTYWRTKTAIGKGKRKMREYWDNYTSSEKEQFQKICRRLLKQTFIVRDKDEENKRAYFFISKRPEPFSRYFGFIGFDVVIDRDNGVVMLRNCVDVSENGRIQTNHLVLLESDRLLEPPQITKAKDLIAKELEKQGIHTEVRTCPESRVRRATVKSRRHILLFLLPA